MSGSARTVFIAGAGIAGLTLALALAKFGTKVVVLERNTAIQEAGAGLQIGPNARRVLNRLGLDVQVAERGFEPGGIDVYPFRSERPLVTLPLGDTARQRYGVPYAVMHRADLADILFRACRRFANVDIVFGVTAFDAASDADGVSITAEEPGGRARSGRGFALAGADGVNSFTRTGLLGGAPAAYSGYVAWRVTLPMDALDDLLARDHTSLLLGPGFHAVCYPLPQHQRLNLVLLARKRAGAVLGGTLPDEPALPEGARRGRLFDAIMAAGSASWSCWPLATVEAASWHEGAIGLVGDAAHAMVPFQAQGAAMAIEDAAVLAPLLAAEASAPSAFARFEALRRRRVARVARLSDFNGFAFHMGWPLALGRNAVLALQGNSGHLRRLDWLYEYDAAGDREEASRPP